MKQFRYEIIAFILILIASVATIQWKKQDVTQERQKKVESILSLTMEKGVPVHTMVLQPETLQLFKLATLEGCRSNLLCTNVSAQERMHLKKGQPVLNAKDESALGRILSISSRRDFRTGLFPVVIKPQGSFEKQAKIVSKILTQSLTDTLIVPLSALAQDNSDYFVWRVNKDHETAERVQVQLGLKNSQSVQIKNGVQFGDEIVTRGSTQVPKYDKIRIVKTISADQDNRDLSHD